MSPSAVRGPRRAWKIRLLVCALGVAALAALGSQLGRLLYAQDAVAHTDAMIVLSGARTERWLEAVDLYHEGLAPRVILSAGGPDDADAELRKRGIEPSDETRQTRDLMVRLGVPREAISILPGKPDNTALEAAAFRRLATTEGWRRVTIVTSKLHTRRARFAFRREFAGLGLEVFVRASRHDRTDPAHWWRTRADVRETLVESVKLVAYSLGLGE